MPGSDEQYDLVRVKDASSNSKADTFFVAPKHLGRDGAGTERMVLKEVGEPPTPPAGNQYLFLATDGLLKAKFADGTVTAIGGESGAPDDAEYVTLSPNGDLSAEALHQDLTGAELHDPAIHSGSHAEGGADPVDVDSLVNADLKADLTAPDGTVLSSQIPDLAVTETFTVPDQAGRLALTDVQEGDVALQMDTDEGYIFTGGDPSLDANWSLLSNFDPPVDSVFGRVGDIVAQAGDYAASQISNFSSTVLSSIDGATITPAQTGTSSSPTNIQAESVTTDSITTDEVDVTAETLVRAGRATDSSLISANTNTPVAIDEEVDNLGEFADGTGRFTPDKSGLYMIYMSVLMRGDTTSGDEIRFVARDETGTFDRRAAYEQGFVDARLSKTMVLRLFAGREYSFLVTNSNNSFTVDGDRDTDLAIVRIYA